MHTQPSRWGNWSNSCNMASSTGVNILWSSPHCYKNKVEVTLWTPVVQQQELSLTCFAERQGWSGKSRQPFPDLPPTGTSYPNRRLILNGEVTVTRRSHWKNLIQLVGTHENNRFLCTMIVWILAKNICLTILWLTSTDLNECVHFQFVQFYW